MKTFIVFSFFVIILGIAAANVVSFKDVIQEEWEAFKQEHGKTYPDENEERFRMKIFMENKHRIARHNYKVRMKSPFDSKLNRLFIQIGIKRNQVLSLGNE
jgi:cathepsin L